MATHNVEVTLKASSIETLKRSIAYLVKHFKTSKPGPTNFMSKDIPLEGLSVSEWCQLYNLQIEGYSSSCHKIPKQYGTIKSIFAHKSQCKVLNFNKKEMLI